VAISKDVVDALQAKFEAVLPHLDERQQRLVMAGEARSLGHGGIAAVARATGASRSRISLGVAELEAGEAPLGRARRPGGGRKPVTETDPELITGNCSQLVEPTRRGDPESVLCWTTLSTRKLADELTAAGHKVASDTAARLLHENGFSLQANSKTLEGASHPDRDAQFSYINDQATAHLTASDPVISVDTKKKELVGDYKNTGQEWRPAGDPDNVKVHDFIGELGKANPYGVYDLAADTGWVSVGTDHDTAEFAVETIRRWWNTMGATVYPNASRLLITADGGGSNGSRTRLWKTELADLATELGLTITVCHLPPGTSKWNKIEHRLFSHISMNWRGRPLTSHEVVVQTIAATTTRTGLTVHADLDTGSYPTGIKIPDATMTALAESGALTRHTWHPDWNYTLTPTPT
jgi:hypothetical protein